MCDTKKQAFVLRVAPSGIDKVPEALAMNQIIIGWAKAKNLLDQSLSWEDFREIISSIYYSSESNMRRAGAASGNMWRFIRDMKENDLVAVPHGSEFYIAKVKGPATYDPSLVSEDSAYRRNVTWLNDKKPIPRMIARSALVSRMKTQSTCVYATDIIQDIQDSLDKSQQEKIPTFYTDLQARLIHETLNEMRSGRIDSYGFEKLIESVLSGLGAKDIRIVPRSQDKGADLLATFLLAGALEQVIAVQVKHWQPEPPVTGVVVTQLIRGIEAESADLGMIITSGTISDDAYEVAKDYFDEKGIKIELIDGEQFAKLIVEHGIKIQ
jgi:predicted Mrr-cat superfamily restriction endonuclease